MVLTLNCKSYMILPGGWLMTFGKRLRQLRLAQRLNQRTLAARVGIDFT
jgi:hypothetical protein